MPPGPRNQKGALKGTMLQFEYHIRDYVNKQLDAHHAQMTAHWTVALTAYHKKQVAPLLVRIHWLETPWWRRTWRHLRQRIRMLRFPGPVVPIAELAPDAPQPPAPPQPEAPSADEATP